MTAALHPECGPVNCWYICPLHGAPLQSAAPGWTFFGVELALRTRMWAAAAVVVFDGHERTYADDVGMDVGMAPHHTKWPKESPRKRPKRYTPLVAFPTPAMQRLLALINSPIQAAKHGQQLAVPFFWVSGLHAKGRFFPRIPWLS